MTTESKCYTCGAMITIDDALPVAEWHVAPACDGWLNPCTIEAPLAATECPHHPRPEWRECHHIGARYVAVRWGITPFGRECWIARSGTVGKRGMAETSADTGLSGMLERLRA